MEQQKVRTKIVKQIRHMVDSAIIKDRSFLDDEQLIRSEQLAVLEEIFNANVRDSEIKELSKNEQKTNVSKSIDTQDQKLYSCN